MATKKARQRISYVLENDKASAGGHRLGVNSLAVDNVNDVLYSGGRDGIVCAWDLRLQSKSNGYQNGVKPETPKTTFRTQTQAHMNWINDIALAQQNRAIVTASSDLSVKIWRPHSQEDNSRAVVIGEHADYVKCLAPPPSETNENWVASGGLDRKIILWDLNGKGKKLEIDVKGDEVTEKGSVYALTVGHNIMAAGGPEKTVKLYDPRTGSQISKLMGHVDNIRSILLSKTGDTVLSASADKTIKLWSITGGRCMYTFTMHDESVWSLFSDDPSLSVFYSSDRAGIVAKTDVRGSLDDMDNGLSLALINEHAGVNSVVATRGHIWTATSQSSINCWTDIDTGAGIEFPEAVKQHRVASIASGRPRQPSIPNYASTEKKKVPQESILRISNTAMFPPTLASEHTEDGKGLNPRPASGGDSNITDAPVKPIHMLPEETIEGQFGLLKHRLLNDRRRVLTLDTAGDVLLWDLIKCKAVQSFGKQHLEHVEAQVNTTEAVAPWCSVDLSSGNLTVTLDSFNCFDAEAYMDALDLEERIDHREDQRVSLGKWVLRYLFDNLINEEVKRDEAYRKKLNGSLERRQGSARAAAPGSIALPGPKLQEWNGGGDQSQTPKASGLLAPTTPGMSIGKATPGVVPPLPRTSDGDAATPEPTRPSAEQPDYFAGGSATADSVNPFPVPAPPTETAENKTEEQNKEKDKDQEKDAAKTPGIAFGKKFRMSFGTKKAAKPAGATADKPATVEEKPEGSEASSTHDKEFDNNFHGVIQKIHHEYEKQASEGANKYVDTLISPSLPNDTPVLKLPPETRIIIQEETSGGNTNLYQGTVESVGRDADTIEQKAPMWLGNVLLHNQPPYKDPIKVSFILHPMDGLPSIADIDGNNRLNANRMLRIKKILAYVAERIELQSDEPPAKDALRPDEYLDLYVYDQKLPITMTLATLRAHIWKGGNDIVLHYKANGRKEIKPVPIPVAKEEPPSGEAEADEANAQEATDGTQ